MIEAAIIMLGVCFVSMVTGTTVYFFHTRTQVEETRRVELVEGTKKQAFETAWVEGQNEKARLALESGVSSNGKTTFDLDVIGMERP